MACPACRRRRCIPLRGHAFPPGQPHLPRSPAADQDGHKSHSRVGWLCSANFNLGSTKRGVGSWPAGSLTRLERVYSAIIISYLLLYQPHNRPPIIFQVIIKPTSPPVRLSPSPHFHPQPESWDQLAGDQLAGCFARSILVAPLLPNCGNNHPKLLQHPPSLLPTSRNIGIPFLHGRQSVHDLSFDTFFSQFDTHCGGQRQNLSFALILDDISYPGGTPPPLV